MSKKILLVSENQSYMVISLKEKFVQDDYEVELKKCEINAMKDLLSQVDAIMIYADDVLIKQQSALNYIKDMALEYSFQIFVTGTEEEMESIYGMIPKNQIEKTYLRPININVMLQEISEAIELGGKTNKKKILVIDDSGAMLRNVKGWLEDKYQVILANSGTMGIKYLALNKPDLILLDYEMPVIDGKQVLEMIRSESDFSSVPVIFLTSKGDKESVVNVMSLKPEGYLLKTLPPAQIIQTIDDFFEKQKAK